MLLGAMPAGTPSLCRRASSCATLPTSTSTGDTMEYFRDILIGSMALLGGAVTLGAICYAINEWVQNRYGR